ncbi:MAG: hypothetical protein HC881_16460 [Leptolyngbyaceae cyanobacterium SL_7_1]|nr:hypothetical protein [Leptolyngbyaceae cyanobacterium SL_7_1]
MKRVPWVSLTLLFTAYITCSWFLYRTTQPWIVGAGMVSFAIIQASLLTTFSKGFRTFLNKWLQSDLGYFSMVLLGAISIAFILVWYHTFEYALVVIGTEVLSRIDLQVAGFNNWQALAILFFVSILGLATSWATYYFLIE